MHFKKGIILAGGLGSRLYPVTGAINKQTLPIYNKPMIYYPMSILMRAGITEIMIISSPQHIGLFEKMFGDGSHLGIKICYEVQKEPHGIGEAFIIAEYFIGLDNVALVLGDNIFHGDIFRQIKRAANREKGATIFTYHVKNPEDYGVVAFYPDGKPMRIMEKPKHYVSNFAVTGLYFYDNNVIKIAKNTDLSARGELEISDINDAYLQAGLLEVEKLPRGTAWLDTGTHDNLMLAAQFVEVIEKRTGLMIANLEEIAYRQKLIGDEQLIELAQQLGKTEYGAYLLDLIPKQGMY